MPIRPVSFLAQAAAQRHASRENESQRKFQKEQALRDFGMNVGQSLIASLGNFGAQAGADAIRFNREEPFKMLEQNINPMPDVTEVPSTVGTGAADALSKAAMARTQTPPPATPPPVSEFTPKPVVPKAAPRATSPALQKTVLPQVNAMQRPASDARYESAFDAPGAPPRVASATPGGSAPPAPPSGGFDALEYMRNPSSVAPPKPRPEVPSPAPAQAPAASPSPMEQAREMVRPGETVSVSQSSRGSVAPEVRLKALQDMDRIAQRWTSGVPLRFQKKDGSEVTPREAAFATAYAMNADLKRLEMLKMQGAIEAEEANSLSARIKAQAEGEAATQKADSDERLKRAQAFNQYMEGAKHGTRVMNAKGGITHDVQGEAHIDVAPGKWAEATMGPDGPLPAGRGGRGGGAPRTSAMFPDAEEVFALGYSETARDDRGRPLVGEKVLPEQYLAPVPNREGLFRYINRKDAPAIKAALDAGDLPTAMDLFKRATAEHASQWDAARGTAVSPTEKAEDAEKKEKERLEAERKAKEEEQKRFDRRKQAREEGIKAGDAARAAALKRPRATDVFPGQDADDAAAALDALLKGLPAPRGISAKEWSTASERVAPYVEEMGPYRARHKTALDEYLDAGGDPTLFSPPPGPSEESPGQFPPPGDESKVDELFQKIESQPWSAERKKRVFLMRAKEAGLA